ncbi:MAG: hypothetical protein AB1324_02195 [Candidatus Micrarchaeota archaeon]
MKMQKLLEVLLKIKPDQQRVIYETPNGVKITATKTQKISMEDVGVGLILPGRVEFFPTHVRLLVDLYLKRISSKKEDLAKLSDAFEQLYQGEDPEGMKEVNSLKFSLHLDEPIANLYYTQLLMAEQAINYSENAKPGRRGKPIKPSKYSPPYAFLMGFIRWALSDNVEVDRLITAAVRNFPPPTKYAKPMKNEKTRK